MLPVETQMAGPPAALKQVQRAAPCGILCAHPSPPRTLARAAATSPAPTAPASAWARDASPLTVSASACAQCILV
jgi:hypothetical protein